jgi:hypothetical protein
MKVARRKGIETVINPAPAIPLPEEAYQGLGHLIVNETEAAILSGIENPQNWNEVAAVFIARGVKNVIITLGGEVRLSNRGFDLYITNRPRVSSTRLRNSKQHPKMAILCQRARSRWSTPPRLATLLLAHILSRLHDGEPCRAELISISRKPLHMQIVLPQ